MAFVILPNIKPTIKIATVSLNRLEKAKTAINTIKLPKLEAITIPKVDKRVVDKSIGSNCKPITTKATPKLAPELSPNTSGPAKGFLNKVCISKPLIDKPMPTAIAVIDLGNR